MLDDDEAPVADEAAPGIDHPSVPRRHHRLPTPSGDVDPSAVALAEAPNELPPGRARSSPRPEPGPGPAPRDAFAPAPAPGLLSLRPPGRARSGAAAQRELLPGMNDVGRTDAVPARDGTVVETVSPRDGRKVLPPAHHVHGGPLAARPLRRRPRLAHLGRGCTAAPRPQPAAAGDQHHQGAGEKTGQKSASNPSFPIHDEIVPRELCRVRSACSGVTETKPSSTAWKSVSGALSRAEPASPNQ